MVLQLYYDLLSQPARSLFIFFKVAQVPFESCIVNLGKGENKKKEYLKNVSRIPKVPVIHDGDFRLNESVAIVRYVSRKYKVENKWYPENLESQAKADEFLEWNHLNIRLNCSSYFLHKWLIPLRTGKEPSEDEIERLRKVMEISLQDFQQYFLSDTNFINGDQVSYVDIHAACEIEQTKMAGYDVRDHFPKIKDWMENVRKQCNPFYDEAHKYLNMIAQNQKEELKAKL